LGIFSIDKAGGGMELIEVAPDVSVSEIRDKTEASFRTRPGLE
jgi:3-oxoacid CoA-transferase subunit B